MPGDFIPSICEYGRRHENHNWSSDASESVFPDHTKLMVDECIVVADFKENLFAGIAWMWRNKAVRSPLGFVVKL